MLSQAWHMCPLCNRKSWAFVSEAVRLLALVPLAAFALALWGSSCCLNNNIVREF
jgi:hypothetical protein